MTHRDPNHEIARIIKRHEQRIADLEERGRGETTPILLRTLRERINVDDSGLTIREQQLEPARWNNETAGWKTSTWGRVE